MSSTLMNSSGALMVDGGASGPGSPMDRGGDDEADAQDEAAEDDAEGDVLVVLHLRAEGEGQDLHEHQPDHAEDDEAEKGEDGGDEELVEQLVRDHHLPP